MTGSKKKTQRHSGAGGNKGRASDKWYSSKLALVVWGALLALIGGAALAYFQGWLAPKTLNVTLTNPRVDSNVVLKDFLNQTGNPTTDYTDDQLAQVGYTIHFQVQLVGYKGRTCRARWEVFDAVNRSRVNFPDWFDRQDSVDIISEAENDSASPMFWVPPVPGGRPFVVRVSVVDDFGTELTYIETEVFTPGRGLASPAQTH